MKKRKTKAASGGAQLRRHKYEVDIVWSEEDGVYIARVPELEGCVTDGEDMLHALANAQDAIDSYLAALKADGKPIPVPLSVKRFSGNIALRVDPSLHRDLVMEADKKRVSISGLIAAKLKNVDHAD